MDPLSITASIIAVVSFAAQVMTTIKDFIDAAQTSDSELEVIVTEVEALRSILGQFQKVYESADVTVSKTHSRFGSKMRGLLINKHNRVTQQVDLALVLVLNGLERGLKRLEEIINKSSDRMAKAGIQKWRVRLPWQRTAPGIGKVMRSGCLS